MLAGLNQWPYPLGKDDDVHLLRLSASQLHSAPVCLSPAVIPHAKKMPLP